MCAIVAVVSAGGGAVVGFLLHLVTVGPIRILRELQKVEFGLNKVRLVKDGPV